MKRRIRNRRPLSVFFLMLLLSVTRLSHADCPAEQEATAASLAAEAASTLDEIDRLLLLKRSVKVCSDYATWLELGKVEMQLENPIDAAYAFENAVDFYRGDDAQAYSVDQVQRKAIANGWLAEAYLANQEVALATVATQEAVGAFEVLGQPVPQRLLDVQGQLDDAMSGASADVLARSMEIQHNRANRGIGVRPRIREQDVPVEQEQQTLALVSDYTGTTAVTPEISLAEVESETAENITTALADNTTVDSGEITTVSSQSTLNIPVLFKFDSAVLAQDSQRTIDQLAEALLSLKLGPADTVAVVGHTDSRGDAAYNRGLSLRRAESVAQVLRTMVIRDAEVGVKVLAGGRGETELRYPGNSRDDHRRNRRVEVVVIR